MMPRSVLDRLLTPLLVLAGAASPFVPPPRPSGPVPPSAAPLPSAPDGDADGDGPRVVVLGGGFGGINAALTLPTLPWTGPPPRITLVDRSERFVFLPLLYELCVDDAAVDEVAPTFRGLLSGSPVDFVRAEVGGVDAPNRRVYVTDSRDGSVRVLEYDALIVATGAEVSLDAVEGAEGRALPFYTVEDAAELRRRLSLIDALLEGDGGGDGAASIAVVGGGYSGVELALNLVDRFAGSGGRVEVSTSRQAGAARAHHNP